MRWSPYVLEALDELYAATPKRRPSKMFNDDDGLNSSSVSRALERQTYSLRDLGPRDLTLELIDQVLGSNDYGADADPKAARYVAARTLELCVLQNHRGDRYTHERRIRFVNKARWKGDDTFRESLQHFFTVVLVDLIEPDPDPHLGVLDLLECTTWAGCLTGPLFIAWEQSLAPSSASVLANVIIDQRDRISRSPSWALQSADQNWFFSGAAAGVLDVKLARHPNGADAPRWRQARDVLQLLATERAI